MTPALVFCTRDTHWLSQQLGIANTMVTLGLLHNVSCLIWLNHLTRLCLNTFSKACKDAIIGWRFNGKCFQYILMSYGMPEVMPESISNCSSHMRLDYTRHYTFSQILLNFPGLKFWRWIWNFPGELKKYHSFWWWRFVFFSVNIFPGKGSSSVLTGDTLEVC